MPLHLGTTHRSTVFTRVLEPVIIITAWAAFWTLWNSALVPAAVAAGQSALAAAAATAAAGTTLMGTLAGWAASMQPAATSSAAHSLALGTRLRARAVFPPGPVTGAWRVVAERRGIA